MATMMIVLVDYRKDNDDDDDRKSEEQEMYCFIRRRKKKKKKKKRPRLARTRLAHLKDSVQLLQCVVILRLQLVHFDLGS